MDLNSLKNIDLSKLKDINLKDIDLSQLKNIDADQIKQLLIRYLDITVNVAVGLLTIIICFQIFGNHSKNIKSVKSKIFTEQALLTVVEQNKSNTAIYTKIKNKFKTYLPGDELLTEVSTITIDTNVQIEKLTPRKEQKSKLLQVSFLDLEISASDYGNIIAFTKEIESLDNSMRITTWSATSKTFQDTSKKQPRRINDRRRRRQREEIATIDKILLKLTLSSINISNEK